MKYEQRTVLTNMVIVFILCFKRIMKTIHETCVGAAGQYGQPGNYVTGANIAGFTKIVESMLDQGVI